MPVILLQLISNKWGQALLLAVAIIAAGYGLVRYGEMRAAATAWEVRQEAIEKRSKSDAEIDQLPESDRRDLLLEWVR
jgi:hypothetical protein